MSEAPEFRFLGFNMPALTIAYGLLLVLWGAAFSIGSESFTSWIPAIIGAPILISGLLARQMPAKRKLWIHIAVVFGLLAFLGGFRVMSLIGSEDVNMKAAASQLMLLVTGAIYTTGCVRSFIWARRQ